MSAPGGVVSGVSQQELELARVRRRLQPTVLEFWQFKAASVASTFRADDLRRFVAARIPGSAPDSAMRVLRDLRLAGKANYRNENRSGSLFRALPLGHPVPKRTPQADEIARLRAVIAVCKAELIARGIPLPEFGGER